MDLERVQAELRPRRPGEAVDLGTRFARTWWPAMLGFWLLTAGPAFLVVHGLLWSHLAWAPLAFWWLKPLYERAPLFFLSRALFGERPTAASTARELHRIAGPGLLGDLSWRRLSPRRSFALPVALLEGARGEARGSRLAVLGSARGTAGWLTLIYALFEALFVLSLLLTAAALVPSRLALDVNHFLTATTAGQVTINVVAFVATAAVAPFYVASGFSLYINRRVELEGWDLEIRFRRLRDRLEGGAGAGRAALVLLALVAALAGVPATPVEATADPAGSRASAPTGPEEAETRIEEVLAHPDFGRMETETRWELDFDLDFEADSDFEIPDFFKWLLGLGGKLAALGEVLLWAAGGVAVYFLLYNLLGWLRQVDRTRTGSRPPGPAPEVLFGLAVTPDSLPADVPGKARELCGEGRPGEALALLYRAGLARLLARVEVPSGATEGEVLRQAEGALDPRGGGLFTELTAAWLRFAYGHRLPEPTTVEDLCRRWPMLEEGDR
ncbi:MAG: DUF4129 domain-containing protein [Thiohalorhabdus sp.]|uniref:DUF4129 domain-containing protein n=1 Tax=Thiohalorhabdus sp. TaxID=3094134 RepID=UPI00397F679C